MKKGKKRWINDHACTLYYQGETRKCFGEDINHLKHKIPEAIQRKWKLRANMNIDELRKISNNEWHGHMVSACGKRISIQIIDRKDRVQEAARLLGQIGGQSGRGKKKVRGDANYYNLLRLKGLEKRLKKHAKLNE